MKKCVAPDIRTTIRLEHQKNKKDKKKQKTTRKNTKTKFFLCPYKNLIFVRRSSNRTKQRVD